MDLPLRIMPGSPVAIYAQIAEQVKKAMSRGLLGENDQLPSVRLLAEQLLINPNTVSRAYAELVREGIIESQPGRGYFVGKKRVVFSEEERRLRFARALDQFLTEALFLDYAEDLVLAQIKKRLQELQTRPTS